MHCQENGLILLSFRFRFFVMNIQQICIELTHVKQVYMVFNGSPLCGSQNHHFPTFFIGNKKTDKQKQISTDIYNRNGTI